MAHFGITHLSAGEAHVFAGGRDQRVWSIRPQPIPHRSGGLGNGIILCLFAVAPAIQNNQDSGCFVTCGHVDSRPGRVLMGLILTFLRSERIVSVAG